MELGNRRLPLGELQEISESRGGPEQPHFQTYAPKNKRLGTGVEEGGGHCCDWSTAATAQLQRQVW